MSAPHITLAALALALYLPTVIGAYVLWTDVIQPALIRRRARIRRQNFSADHFGRPSLPGASSPMRSRRGLHTSTPSNHRGRRR